MSLGSRQGRGRDHSKVEFKRVKQEIEAFATVFGIEIQDRGGQWQRAPWVSSALPLERQAKMVAARARRASTPGCWRRWRSRPPAAHRAPRHWAGGSSAVRRHPRRRRSWRRFAVTSPARPHGLLRAPAMSSVQQLVVAVIFSSPSRPSPSSGRRRRDLLVRDRSDPGPSGNRQ